MPGIAFFGFFGGLYPAYERGEADLAMQHGALAASESRNLSITTR
jgi:hypothetical protein